jgi:hypothetical protein
MHTSSDAARGRDDDGADELVKSFRKGRIGNGGRRVNRLFATAACLNRSEHPGEDLELDFR